MYTSAVLSFFKKMAQTWPLFVYFRFLYRKNCTTQLGPFCVQILSSWRIIRYPKSRIKNLIYFMEPLITTSIVVLQHCSLNIYCTEEKSDMIFSHRLPPPPSMDLQFCLPLSCEISQKSFCKLT